MGRLHGICRIHMDHAAFSAASAAASSSCNLINDGGGLTTMLLFHCRSNFLDNLLPIPSSISLSRLTKKKITLLRIRRNSLDVNSLRADFWRRSMKSSPLSSTTSSLISSVVLVLISFISSSLLAIITTEDDEQGLRNDAVGRRTTVFGQARWNRRPLKEDLGIGESSFAGNVTVEGGAMEIAPSIVFQLLSVSPLQCFWLWDVDKA
ncbi:unnamed protein product [Prunus brigantina]